jgi:hypothetical protein
MIDVNLGMKLWEQLKFSGKQNLLIHTDPQKCLAYGYNFGLLQMKKIIELKDVFQLFRCLYKGHAYMI